MEIEFTQYLMPDGKQKKITIDRPNAIAEKAKQLLEKNCRFEIEMLTTGHISMTIEQDGVRKEPAILAHEICSNGPEVITRVDKIIN